MVLVVVVVVLFFSLDDVMGIHLEGIHEDKIFKRRPINVFGTRGHKYKLFKSFCKLDVKKFSFGNRVINEWNSLPDAVVNSVSINDFKGKLDHHLALMRGFI